MIETFLVWIVSCCLVLNMFEWDEQVRDVIEWILSTRNIMGVRVYRCNPMHWMWGNIWYMFCKELYCMVSIINTFILEITYLLYQWLKKGINTFLLRLWPKVIKENAIMEGMALSHLIWRWHQDSHRIPGVCFLLHIGFVYITLALHWAIIPLIQRNVFIFADILITSRKIVILHGNM